MEQRSGTQNCASSSCRGSDGRNVYDDSFGSWMGVRRLVSSLAIGVCFGNRRRSRAAHISTGPLKETIISTAGVAVATAREQQQRTALEDSCHIDCHIDDSRDNDGNINNDS